MMVVDEEQQHTAHNPLIIVRVASSSMDGVQKNYVTVIDIENQGNASSSNIVSQHQLA